MSHAFDTLISLLLSCDFRDRSSQLGWIRCDHQHPEDISFVGKARVCLKGWFVSMYLIYVIWQVVIHLFCTYHGLDTILSILEIIMYLNSQKSIKIDTFITWHLWCLYVCVVFRWQRHMSVAASSLRKILWRRSQNWEFCPLTNTS